ncbi:MAG: hypothetical protein VCA55_14590 [Verrucomicrobiales bacterium]
MKLTPPVFSFLSRPAAGFIIPVLLGFFTLWVTPASAQQKITAANASFDIPEVVTARTWTDAATKRTLRGDFVEVDGTKVVIKLDTGKTVSVAIDRLIDADKKFIKAQKATPAAKEGEKPAGNENETGPSTGPLTRLTPPVSVKPHPIQGEGKKRKAGLEATNNSNKNISKLVLEMYYLKEDGSVGKSVPYTISGFFDNPKDVLGKGKSHLIDVDSFFMEDDTASVDGLVSQVEWDDGIVWPTWTGPAPKRKDDVPVAVKMIGVLGEGDRADPVVAVFNLGSKGISNVSYGIAYLDADGKTLDRTGYGYSGADDWLPAGKGTAISGGSSGPPQGTVDVKVTVNQVIFDDKTVWKPKK